MNTGDIDVHEFAKTVDTSLVPVFGEIEPGFTPADLQAFNCIVNLLKKRQLPQKKLRELMSAIGAYEEDSYGGEDGDDDDYDETFDMEKEVAEVLRTVKILRRTILSPNKRALKAGVTVGDAKDVLSMSNSMIATLMKSHEKIMNMARYRAVEQATVDILRELDGAEKLVTDLEDFQASGAKGDGPLVTSFLTALEARLDQ